MGNRDSEPESTKVAVGAEYLEKNPTFSEHEETLRLASLYKEDVVIVPEIVEKLVKELKNVKDENIVTTFTDASTYIGKYQNIQAP